MIFKAKHVYHSKDFMQNGCILLHGYELSEECSNVAKVSDRTRICEVIKTEIDGYFYGPFDEPVNIYFEIKPTTYIPDGLILVIGNRVKMEILHGTLKGRTVEFLVEEVKDDQSNILKQEAEEHGNNLNKEEK